MSHEQATAAFHGLMETLRTRGGIQVTPEQYGVLVEAFNALVGNPQPEPATLDKDADE